jgi:hypothetical protein
LESLEEIIKSFCFLSACNFRAVSHFKCVTVHKKYQLLVVFKEQIFNIPQPKGLTAMKDGQNGGRPATLQKGHQQPKCDFL